MSYFLFIIIIIIYIHNLFIINTLLCLNFNIKKLILYIIFHRIFNIIYIISDYREIKHRIRSEIIGLPSY